MNNYLEDGFDPETLKVAQLRRILLENNVTFSSKATKKDLLKLYTDFIQPIIPDLRKNKEKDVINLSFPSSSSSSSSSISDSVSDSSGENENESEKAIKEKSDDNNHSQSPNKKDNHTINKNVLSFSTKNQRTSSSSSDISMADSLSSLDSNIDNNNKKGKEIIKTSYKKDDSDDSSSNPSDSSLMDILETARFNTPQKQAKKRKISETIDLTDSSDSDNLNNTPIIKKIAKKSPSKISPSKSIDTTEFNISDSESENEIVESSNNIVTSNNNTNFDKENVKDKRAISNQLNPSLVSSSTKKKNDDFDFSFKRRKLSPDVSKLNASPAFANQLNMALDEETNKENNNETDIQSTNNRNSFNELSNLKSINQKPVVLQNQNEVKTYKLNTLPAFNDENRTTGIESPIDTKTPDKNHDLMEVDSDSDNKLIRTPELPTEQDVKDSELRVNQLREMPRKEHDEKNNAIVVKDSQSSSNDTETVSIINEKTRDVIDLDADLLPEVKEVDEVKKPENSEEDILILTLDTSIKPKKSWLHHTKFILVFLIKLILVTLVVICLFFSTWYYQQRIAIGYCNQEIELPSLHESYPNVRILEIVDSILEYVKPGCLPCPPNTICFPNMEIKCESQFRLEKPFFNIYNTIPFFDKCVEDNKRNELINEIVDKSLEFLRLKNAQLYCGNNDDDTESGISELDLFNIFNEAKNSNFVADSTLNEIWESVVNILKEQPDITYRQVSNF